MWILQLLICHQSVNMLFANFNSPSYYSNVICQNPNHYGQMVPLAVEHRCCTEREMRTARGRCACSPGFCSTVLQGRNVCCKKCPTAITGPVYTYLPTQVLTDYLPTQVQVSKEVCSLNAWSAEQCFNGYACDAGYESRSVNGRCVCCEKLKIKACYCVPGANCRPQACLRITPIEHKKCSKYELKSYSDCPSAVCSSDYVCKKRSPDATVPICCKKSTSSGVIVEPGSNEIVPYRELPTCPVSGVLARKTCQFDENCDTCGEQCLPIRGINVCCSRTRTGINGTVVAPIARCDLNGACGENNICINDQCYRKAQLGGDWNTRSCPDLKPTSVFCDQGCCPKAFKCVGGICCTPGA